jgi:probable F420-dependent oxidoreductase
MQFGIFMVPTDESMAPGELATEVEARGFHALLFPEHTHIPASRETPDPGGGGELRREASRCLDPFVALTAAAAVTERIRLGTGVCLVIERDPIALAKSVASLDRVSGGRFDFGIGGGWNREEMANHGTDYATRWTLLRERIEAMKAIWTQDEASYEGRFVRFERIWSWPKPTQRPHPPIVVGGDGERTLQRVVRYGDEWMPIGRGEGTFGPRIRELQELAARAGRGPIPVSVWGASTRPEVLEAHQRDGVYRCIFLLPSAGRDTVLPRLDRVTTVMRDFSGG